MFSSIQGRLPGLCEPPRYMAGPHPTLSMARSRPGVTPLWTCPPPAGQMTLPRAIRSRLEAAAKAFLLAEKEGHIRRRGRWLVHNAGQG
jgi:hypothetical protein